MTGLKRWLHRTHWWTVRDPYRAINSILAEWGTK